MRSTLNQAEVAQLLRTQKQHLAILRKRPVIVSDDRFELVTDSTNFSHQIRNIQREEFAFSSSLPSVSTLWKGLLEIAALGLQSLSEILEFPERRARHSHAPAEPKTVPYA